MTRAALKAPDGAADETRADFTLKPGIRRLQIDMDDAHTDVGAFPTCVKVSFRVHGSGPEPRQHAFTFLPRDVSSETPMLVRGLDVAVTPADDERTFAQIDAAIRARGLRSVREAIDDEEEETYEEACSNTRSMRASTWLGIGRDMRIFRVMPSDANGYWGQIEPCDFGTSIGPGFPRNSKNPLRYLFILGRGAQCRVDIQRWLDEGVLPIVKSVQRDGKIEYHVTVFVTLEREVLTAERVRGTHPTAAFANTRGAMLTEAERSLYDKTLRATEAFGREQEVICWVHVEAVNTDAVPRHAYVKAGYIKASFLEGVGDQKFVDGNRSHADGGIFAVNRLNGRPMPQEEMAILLAPGKKLTLDILFPHRPINRERAAALAKQSFDDHYRACRQFWRDKLRQGATIRLPEKAVEERVNAGLLHLDVATLGMATSGPLLTPVGWYAPIGSESAPIMQYYDSVGYHELAERAIQFFLDRQREDGFIQTCLGYQLETGPVLWTIGEHFRYTRDIAWARRIQPNVLRACRYLLAWRRRNMREELRGKGYGLLEGKVADPPDFFHSFMLNGVTYVGLKRIAEVYDEVDPGAFAFVKQELAPYLADIRKAYAENVAASPLVPLGDGTWIPSFSPWAEYRGPVSLYTEGGSWFSHSMFASRDSLIGVLYLGIGEVLDPREPLARWLLDAHQELMTSRNAGFSQPYYYRHDWLYMRRGEVKQFLKTYYNQFASLQDRETYTFWEHYVGAGESEHKTHEEAWFLMQTRWMLWNEEHETGTLRLLSMIPRAWLGAGKVIKLENCKSHFGPFNLEVRCGERSDRVDARLQLLGPADRHPKVVSLRLPDPASRRPRDVRGGRYVAESEAVIIRPTTAPMRVVVRYT